MKKKLTVFIQANCQSHAIRNIFQKVDRLSDKYEIIDVKPVHLWIDEDKEEIIEKISECDIFLHQPIDKRTFGFYASENLLQMLKPEAKSVSFPNLYFTGYHPQAFYLKDDDGKKVSEPFDYHDRNIVEFFKHGLSTEEILEKIEDESFYSEEEIKENIEQSLKALRGREKYTDIKVSDYIEENMIGNQLFHIFNHPSNEMTFYLFNKILVNLYENKLSDDEKILFKNEFLGQIRYPIYPSVQKYFDINEELVLSNYKKEYSFGDMINIYFETYTLDNLTIRNDLEKVEQAGDKSDNNCRTELIDTLLPNGTKKILNNVVPKHPRLKIGDKLFFPETFVEKQKNIFVKFGKVCTYSHEKPDSNIESLGKVLNLWTPGAVVYTHWLFDLVPKILCLKKAGLNIDDYDTIIVNATHAEFQKASFEALGLNESKIIPLHKLGDNHYKCTEIVNVSPVRKNYATNLWIIDFVKEIFPKHKPSNDFSKKIYISRDKSARRKVINEIDVVSFLVSQGFDVLYCEDYTINEVHYILSEATTVVAPHGAGVANIAFCKPATRVIELFSQHISPEYYYFSEVLNLNYMAIACQDKDGLFFDDVKLNYKNCFMEINSADIFVDLNKLKNLNLKKIGVR